MTESPVTDKPPVQLTPKHKHTIHELTRKAKGTYVQLLQLCKELDIPFPQ